MLYSLTSTSFPPSCPIYCKSPPQTPLWGVSDSFYPFIYLLPARCQSVGTFPRHDWHKPQRVHVELQRGLCVFFVCALGRGRMPHMPEMSKATRAVSFEYSALLTRLSVCVRRTGIHSSCTPDFDTHYQYHSSDYEKGCVCVYIYICL